MPLTYTWEASGQVGPVTHVLGGLTDTVTLSWMALGSQTVTVTALNPVGVVTDMHTIAIEVRRWCLYLPIVLRNGGYLR